MALLGFNLGASKVRGLGQRPKLGSFSSVEKRDTLNGNAPRLRPQHLGCVPYVREITGRGIAPEDEGPWGRPLRPRIKTDRTQGFPYWLLSSSPLRSPK